MDKTNEKSYILNENLWKVMWRMSWPAVIAMVLYGLNSVFDAIFVGTYVGEIPLAGVTLAYPFSQMTLALGSLVGVGAGSLLSISLGSNDKKMQGKLLGNLNYLTILISVLYVIIAYTFAETLIRAMGGSGEALSQAVLYFRITTIGTPLWVHGLAGNLIIRAEGKMKTAAVLMGVGLIINIISNYILIVILDMGVAGAALGTNIGMLAYTISGIIYFKSGKSSFESEVFCIRRDKDIQKKIISLGGPSLIMSVMMLIQSFVIFNALSNLGTVKDIAFYGAANRIYLFSLTPIFGLMRALQPVVGINFGAEKYERVIKSFKIFTGAATLLMLPILISALVIPEITLAFMLPGRVFSPENILHYRVYISAVLIMPIVFMTMTFFPAIDNGKPSAILGIARQLIFLVPTMLILPKIFGVQFIYYGTTGIDILIVLIVLYLIRKEFKKLMGMGKTNVSLKEKTS